MEKYEKLDDSLFEPRLNEISEEQRSNNRMPFSSGSNLSEIFKSRKSSFIEGQQYYGGGNQNINCSANGQAGAYNLESNNARTPLQ